MSFLPISCKISLFTSIYQQGGIDVIALSKAALGGVVVCLCGLVIVLLALFKVFYARKKGISLREAASDEPVGGYWGFLVLTTFGVLMIPWGIYLMP